MQFEAKLTNPITSHVGYFMCTREPFFLNEIILANGIKIN